MDTKETLAAFLGALATFLGGGWLTQWMKNRGTMQTRHGDELSDLRAELRAEIAQLRVENKELRNRIDDSERQIFAVQLSYAVFREKVRTAFRLVRAGDDSWKTLADDIESDEHDVDAMFEWWRHNKSAISRTPHGDEG